MAINTGLSVPVFNVLKYLFILVFIDIIVRRSLDSIEHFFRRHHLFHGRSVIIQKNLIDRYNLFRVPCRANLRHMLFMLALISCAYAVEMCLEFSSDAVTNVVAYNDHVNLLNATHSACTYGDIIGGKTVERVVALATKCVDIDLDQDTYKMYNIDWELDHRRIITPLCVKTPENIRHEGKLIYDTLQYAEGSREANATKQFLHALRANSWNSNGDTEREVLTFQITNSDMIEIRRSRLGNDTFLSAGVILSIPNTTIVCGGEIYGKIGEGQMLVQFSGCGEIITADDVTSDIHSDVLNLDDTNSDGTASSVYGNASYHFMYIAGTAAVFMDAKDLGSKEWTAYVATRPGMIIYDFASGVIEQFDRATVQAFAALLSLGSGRDFGSINKYAVAFKHCTSYRVPKETDEVREQDFYKARERQQVTVVVYEWALLMITLWPTMLGFVGLCLNWYGNRKRLPFCLHGERAIARRWAWREFGWKFWDDSGTGSDEERGNVDRVRFSDSAQGALFLVVQVGEEEDDVVASYERRDVERDVSRKFKRL